MTNNNALATEIADYCFTPAFSEAAVVRLAMMTADGRDLGGLSKEQFRTRIAAILAKNAEPAEPEPVTMCTCDCATPCPLGKTGSATRCTADELRDALVRKVEPEPVKANDPLAEQVGGSHYKDMPIQPVEFIHGNGIGYMEGCAIKYLSRWKSKGGVEDLRKAIHFVELLIELSSRGD